jgi:serine/threonine protein kinase
MQPERLEKVKSLLASALSVPPEEREAFLRGACAGDPSLRHDIDSYLGKGDRTDRFFHQAQTVPNAHISLENPSAQVTMQIPADPRIGQEIGKYHIKQRVAEGGMGVVYLATDTQLGRDVAIKVLPEFFSMDRERLSRFHREARATSLLNHPNIVTVFEMGQWEGCEFIVTEYIEGRTLRDLMRQGQIPFVEMLKIASQVAGAMAAAHRAGIIHRDIKPENVMIRPDGYVKVLDFGLAKLTDTTRRTTSGNVEFAPSGLNHTTPGMIMGTVSYMSPEQAEGLETDVRTDIWALGVILYEMIAGKLPFKGPTPSHTIVAILEQDPAPLQNASPELQRIISTALQKDRALRFQTAEAMSAAIDELKQRLGYISDKNITGPAPTARSIAAARPARAPNPYRKLFWLVPAAFAVLLIGTIAVYSLAPWLSWLLEKGRQSAEGRPADDSSPTPVATVEATPYVYDYGGTPTPSPATDYVDPTPQPTPDEPEPEPPVTTRPRERQRDPEPRTRPEPRRTPVKKPPKQDPNCVFTNSCK